MSEISEDRREKMATNYYYYHIPDGRKTLEEELQEKKFIGVRTLESGKKRCFTWALHPAEFLSLVCWHSRLGIVDEYGNKQILPSWLEQLKEIDIMRYNRDEIPAD